MPAVSNEDTRRVAGITAYDVLDQPPRRELLAVVDLAARICDVPMATINLITDTEQHQIATVGFDASVCRREDSMCAAGLGSDVPIVVPDARLDPRFADNPFVTGSLGSVRFYAAHKLLTRDGTVIGTLCVFDSEPRTIDEDQAAALGTLADRIVDILELSLTSRELAATLVRVEAMKRELEQSNERLTSFAGQVSHDLKNPLTSVVMSLGMVREQLAAGGGIGGSDGDVDAVWLLDRAINGSARMAALIDDVLDYARVGSSLKTAKVDLDLVMKDVRVDLAGALAGVVVEVQELPTVVGDEVQLRSVLQNLLGNAAKFRTPERSPVVRVCAERVGARWRVEVSDNGRGVPPGLRVFEPLTRADDSVAGSGIGLATCRRVVEAHDGRIGFEPAPGGGTTFWFELPA